MEFRINRKEIKLDHHVDMPIFEMELNDKSMKATSKLLYAIMNNS